MIRIRLSKNNVIKIFFFQDNIEVSPEKLVNYEEMIKKFFEEHIHIDEEVRYCLEGSGNVRFHSF